MRINSLAPRGLVLPLLVLALCGCSAKGRAQAENAAFSVAGDAAASYEGAGFNPEAPADRARQAPPAFKDMGSPDGRTGQAPEAPGLNEPERSQKLIKNARIRTRVENLEEAAALVEAVLERYQAYASDSSVNDTSRRYTLKIPSAYYEAALGEFGNIGKIIHRSETVEDATLRYYDLDGRLNTRLELLKTFQAYLGKAKTIEEIMTVEKRIAELQQEIDWYGAQLTSLSHLIDYATINLELMGPAAEYVYYKPPVKDRIAELFRSFADVASTALVVLVGIFIYGIPAFIVIMLLFWILFGRIGLLRRAWRLAAAKKSGKQGASGPL